LSVENKNVDMPLSFELFQNYPNPFNPVTQIQYSLPDPVAVSIKVYNTMGQLVTTLIDQYQFAGTYHIEWNGRDDKGNWVSNGLYIYQMYAGSYTQTCKMILVK
jgi:flagellar hook assembly protein FlgD